MHGRPPLVTCLLCVQRLLAQLADIRGWSCREAGVRSQAPDLKRLCFRQCPRRGPCSIRAVRTPPPPNSKRELASHSTFCLFSKGEKNRSPSATQNGNRVPTASVFSPLWTTLMVWLVLATVLRRHSLPPPPPKSEDRAVPAKELGLP